MVVIKTKIKVENTTIGYERWHITGILEDKEFCVEFVPLLEIWNDVNNNLRGGVDIRRIRDHYFEQCVKKMNENIPFYWE